MRQQHPILPEDVAQAKGAEPKHLVGAAMGAAPGGVGLDGGGRGERLGLGGWGGGGGGVEQGQGGGVALGGGGAIESVVADLGQTSG